MTRTTFGFFRNPIQQIARSSMKHIASMAVGTYCGLNLFKLQRDKTPSSNTAIPSEAIISPELLLNLIVPSAHRYPYLDEQQRAEIFENFFEHTKERYDQATLELFLRQAVESDQFTAINAIVRAANHLASPELLQNIAEKLTVMSYQMIKLQSENKLTKPFEEAFFSSKSGVEVPRVFFDHPNLAEDVANYINETKNTNEPHGRSIFFHDGNMTYNQTIVTASLHGDQLAFHLDNSCEQDAFYKSLQAKLFNNTDQNKLFF